MEREQLIYWGLMVAPVVVGILLAAWILSFLTPRQRRRDDLAGREKR